MNKATWCGQWSPNVGENADAEDRHLLDRRVFSSRVSRLFLARARQVGFAFWTVGGETKPHQVWESRAKYSMQNGTFTVKPLITHLPFFESAIHFMHG